MKNATDFHQKDKEHEVETLLDGSGKLAGLSSGPLNEHN